MSSKIIQIITSPENMGALYKVEGEGEFIVPLACLALVEYEDKSRAVVGLIPEDKSISRADHIDNFKGYSNPRIRGYY